MSIGTPIRKPVHPAVKLAVFCVFVGIVFYLYASRLLRAQQLARAVEQGDTASALRLLATGADPNKPTAFNDDEAGWSDILLSATVRKRHQGPPVLLSAISNDNEVVVNALLQHGADPNTHNDSGMTPLMAAALSNNLNEIAELLRKGAKIDMADRNNRTALCFATRNGRIEAAKLLCAHGARIDIREKTGDTPLTDAVRGGDIALIALFVQLGADVNVHNQMGETPLTLAANHNDMRSVQLLLDHRADVNIQTRAGDTALMLAASYNNPRLIQLLLDHGANVNIRDHDGNPALFRLFDNRTPGIVGVPGGFQAIGGPSQPPPDHDTHIAVRLLLSHGADAKYRGVMGDTALMHAAPFSDVNTLQQLLDAGVDVHARGRAGWEGQTALSLAAGAANLANLRFLLAHDAGRNLRADPKPFVLAALNPNGKEAMKILKILLDRGADVNGVVNMPVFNGSGVGIRAQQIRTVRFSPLLQAASRGDLATVKVLLAHGANVNLKDENGATALSTAVTELAAVARVNGSDKHIPRYRAIIALLKQAAKPTKTGP